MLSSAALRMSSGLAPDAAALSADAARTFAVGQVTPVAGKLLDTTKASLFDAVEQCRAGNRLGDVSHAVQARVEGDGLSVVRSLVGHGIGRSMHEDPQIPNYGDPGRGPLLEEGMVLAVEPGAYWPGGGGLRVEDNFLVTVGGVEKLSSFPDGVVRCPT